MKSHAVSSSGGHDGTLLVTGEGPLESYWEALAGSFGLTVEKFS
jgi:hypothetical protein